MEEYLERDFACFNLGELLLEEVGDALVEGVVFEEWQEREVRELEGFCALFVKLAEQFL